MTVAMIAPAAQPRTHKRALQAVIAAAGVVPVYAGLAGIVRGAHAGDVTLDSHFRYLSGLLLGLGLVFWSAIPSIERQGRLVRGLTFMVALGGLARLYSLSQVGWPGVEMRWALVMELIVTPAICIWQYRLSRAMDAAPWRR